MSEFAKHQPSAGEEVRSRLNRLRRKNWFGSSWPWPGDAIGPGGARTAMLQLGRAGMRWRLNRLRRMKLVRSCPAVPDVVILRSAVRRRALAVESTPPALEVR